MIIIVIKDVPDQLSDLNAVDGLNFLPEFKCDSIIL